MFALYDPSFIKDISSIRVSYGDLVHVVDMRQCPIVIYLFDNFVVRIELINSS